MNNQYWLDLSAYQRYLLTKPLNDKIAIEVNTLIHEHSYIREKLRSGFKV